MCPTCSYEHLALLVCSLIILIWAFVEFVKGAWVWNRRRMAFGLVLAIFAMQLYK